MKNDKQEKGKKEREREDTYKIIKTGPKVS
jgi:hypothetical protein